MTNYPVAVTVKNSGGASSSASSVIVTTTAGGGGSFPDGFIGAPTGTPQFPTILNGYGGTGARNKGLIGGIQYQPPHNVPGVDYYVGPDASAFPLKDPMPGGVIAPALSSFCAVFDSGQTIRQSGDNHVIDGWDFSLHGGVRLIIQGNNCTVQNCLFRTGTNTTFGSYLEALDIDNLTVKNCEMDGANTQITNVPPLINLRTGGTLNVNYCYIHNAWTIGVQVSADRNPPLISFQFNVFNNIDFGWAPARGGWHGDVIQAFSGAGSLGVPTFQDLEGNYNLIFQNGSAADYHSQGYSFTTGANTASYKVINWTGNTCICPAGSNMNAFFLADMSEVGSGGQAAPVNGTCTATNNYTDVSANNNPDPCAVWSIGTYPTHGGKAPGAENNNYYHGHFSQTNTVNMITGGLVTPPVLDY